MRNSFAIAEFISTGIKLKATQGTAGTKGQMNWRVKQFRAYQVALDHVTVDIVPGTAYQRNAILRECRQRWEEVLGPGMKVTVRLVEDLPYEASGKLRYFVPMSANHTSTADELPE